MIKIGEGNHALEVSRLGYGCMGLTAFYGDAAVSEEEGIRILKRAFDLGVRHFDTAQLYQRKLDNGTIIYNETLVGKFLKTIDKEKEGVTVATKYFPRTNGGKLIWTKEIFMKATEESLQRLGVECIDLYYLHRIYPEEIVPIEECMNCMKELVEDGKVKCVGLSEASAQIIKRAHKVHPVTAVQQEWSLFARDLEDEIVPTCKELGIGIVAYSPVARGFLAGMVKAKGQVPKDFRSEVPYLKGENLEDNLKLINDIEEMAKLKNCTLSQLCVAWVMAKGGIPIPGTTNIKHLEENLGASNVSLTGAEVKRLDELGNKVKGERGNEQYMNMTFHRHNI